MTITVSQFRVCVRIECKRENSGTVETWSAPGSVLFLYLTFFISTIRLPENGKCGCIFSIWTCILRTASLVWSLWRHFSDGDADKFLSPMVISLGAPRYHAKQWPNYSYNLQWNFTLHLYSWKCVMRETYPQFSQHVVRNHKKAQIGTQSFSQRVFE